MYAASPLVIDAARQEIADKVACAELHRQRREACATDRAACSTQPVRYGRVWFRLINRHA